MREIRWHARAGQGAKTASQLYAVAMLRAGKSVQAFPEYGPERRGAPLRAYTRIDERAIRRHDAVTTPDVVVVLQPSLVAENGVAEGLRPGGLVLVNTERAAEEICALLGCEARVVCIPAERLSAPFGTRSVNLVMLGALAAVLGEPPLEPLAEAATELLGAKVEPEQLRAPIEAGFAVAREELACAS